VKLVKRGAWNARPPTAVTPLKPSRGVAVHYSASDADEQSQHRNCASRVRGIQRYHMQTQGWNDIAYSYLFCKHGYVFEGRGAHARTAANGTNAGNSGYLAVCFLGDDSKNRDDVTDSGREALVDIRRHLLMVHPQAKETVGHRDITSTTCPGDQLYRFIHTNVFKAAIHKLPKGRPWPVPLPAWFWDWAEWRLQGRSGPRPKDAPGEIPDWAWRRLEALQKARKGD
jgi:N-acetylmuramoyl-L-alanine amidase